MVDSVTVVTGFFNLHDSRNVSYNTYLERGLILMNVDVNFIIFCDPGSYLDIWKMRRDANLLHKTLFIVMNLREFSFYYYVPKIIMNREKIPVENPVKHTPDYFILTVSKFEMMEIAITKNPFNSNHFTWVDFGISRIDKSLTVEDYRKSLTLLHDNFMAMFIHYRTEKDISDRRRFHTNVSTTFAAGCFSGKTEIMSFICSEIRKEFIDLINKGYGYAEETIMFEVYLKHRDMFNTYPGDYYSVISNRLGVTKNISEAIKFYIVNSRLNNDHSNTYRACRQIYDSWKSAKVEISAYDILRLFDEMYISQWYLNKKLDCIYIVEEVARLLDDENIAGEFKRNIDHFTRNYDLIDIVLNKAKILVKKELSDSELENLCKDYHVFIQKEEDEKEIDRSYLLTSNPVKRFKYKLGQFKFTRTLI